MDCEFFVAFVECSDISHVDIAKGTMIWTKGIQAIIPNSLMSYIA